MPPPPTLRSPPTPTPGHRFMLWALFLGFALTALFLSSEPLQGINDLERHAGLALRVVLIAWAAPIFANVRLRLRAGDRPTVAGRWVIGLTTVMVFIGLGGPALAGRRRPHLLCADLPRNDQVQGLVRPRRSVPADSPRQ